MMLDRANQLSSLHRPAASVATLHRVRLLALLLLVASIGTTVPPAAGHVTGVSRAHLQNLEACAPDAFAATACREARIAMERAMADDLVATRTSVRLAQAHWNASWLDGTDDERAAWRGRARALVRQAIARDPSNAEPYFALSTYSNDALERIDLLQLTVERDARHPEAHALLARLLLLEGHTDEAVAAYRAHLDVSQYRGRADGFEHVAFAHDLAAAGRTQDAAGILERLLALSRHESRFERCMVLKAIDLERFARFDAIVRAVERLRLCCTRTAQRDRAVRLEREGRIEAAIDALEQQLRENPYYEETYALLARLRRERGEAAEAWRVVKRSLDMETESHERCRKYRELMVGAYAGIAPADVARLRLECEE